VIRGENHPRRLHPELTARGERHPMSRLTEDQVRTIRAAYASGTRQTVLARMFQISQVTVSAIVRRRLWKHVE
jgi:predicted DNA binding protein